MSDIESTHSITIVIPTRDRKDQLLRCLDSLRRQTHRGFEVIVVNDGSSDETASALASYFDHDLPFEFKTIHHSQPRGANPSRNEAIGKSNGTLIGFLDDDCIADNNWLERLRKPFCHAEVAAATGHVENIALSNQWERFFIGQHRVSSKQENGILIANRLVAGNLLVRSECLGGALDEDRATVSADMTTSARGDEEGLRIKIFRSGKLIAHVPEAICEHDHPYDFRSFCRQAFKSGRSTARLAKKYRLKPRWELLALAAAVVMLPVGFLRMELAVVCCLFFALFLFAVLYNELVLKQKSLWQTCETVPALLVYYTLRSAGYMMTFFIARES